MQLSEEILSGLPKLFDIKHISETYTVLYE